MCYISLQPLKAGHGWRQVTEIDGSLIWANRDCSYVSFIAFVAQGLFVFFSPECVQTGGDIY